MTISRSAILITTTECTPNKKLDNCTGYAKLYPVLNNQIHRIAIMSEKLKAYNVLLPVEVGQMIDEYMANATPAQLKAIDAASFNAEPHAKSHMAFTAYAIREILKRTSTPRAFGSKIDQDVAEIMDRNIAAFEENPAEWWNLTAIGSSLLRDKGHNPNSVKRWMEENAGRLAEHHAQVGITDPLNHNRKAGKARKAVQP